MSANINANVLKNFIIKQIGANHLTEKTAQKAGISKDQYAEANVDENKYLELDEILQDNDLYEQFATLYVAEQERLKTRKLRKRNKPKLKVKTAQAFNSN